MLLIGDDYIFTVVFNQIKEKCPWCLPTLTNQFANMSNWDPVLVSPVMHAVRQIMPNAVELLLNHGAYLTLYYSVEPSPNSHLRCVICSDEKTTILFLAVRKKVPSILASLLDYFTPTEMLIPDKKGNILLHQTILENDVRSQV